VQEGNRISDLSSNISHRNPRFKKIHEIQILGAKGQNTHILYVDLKGDESEYKAVSVAKVTM
jgi:hypothetical protein